MIGLLYIEKRMVPNVVQEKKIQIEKSEEWKKISNGDISAVRIYFDSMDKSIIREALIAEQHGLCAYCMKRIRNDQDMVIEHLCPISDKKHALDFQNMLGCCDGGRREESKGRVLCCDASKKNIEITLNPFNKSMMEDIMFTKDGRIKTKSGNKKIENELNNVLHLNGELDKDGNIVKDTATNVVRGRRGAYKNYEKTMQKLSSNCKSKTSLVTEIKKLIKKIESRAEYPEYVGVTLYYLKRRIKG